MFNSGKNSAVALRMLAATALVALAGHGPATFAADAADGIPSFLRGEPDTRQSLGLMELTLSGDASRPESWSLHSVNPPREGATTETVSDLGAGGIDTEVAYVSTPFVANGEHYYFATFNVRYAPTCSTPATCTGYTTTARSGNLTLIAAGTPGSLGYSTSTGNAKITAVHYINSVSGSVSTSVPNAATVALSVLPTNPLSYSGGVLSELKAATNIIPSLQVFKESEVAGLANSANGTSVIFPYGFVISCTSTRSGACKSGSRSLPPATPNNWDGQVSVAVKVPVVSSPSETLSVSIYYEAMNDTNTRVTQSVEAENYTGDLAAISSAAALGSSDLAILGGASPTNSATVAPTGYSAAHAEQANYSGYDPICSVRTAGLSTAPAAYLVHTGTSPTVAAAPYGLPTTIAANATANFWFCQNMSTPTASNLVISGSQSGTRMSTTSGSRLPGTWSGGGSENLTFNPSATGAFYPGETVNYSITSGLTASGTSTAVTPFVGSYVASATGGGLRSSSPTSGVLTTVSTVNMPSALLGSAANRYAEGSVVADFNNDGLPDVVNSAEYVNGFTGGGVIVGLNNTSSGASSTTFSTAAKYSAGSTAYAIATGDFNGDGYSDIVTTNYVGSTTSNLQVLLNNGAVLVNGNSSPGTFKTAVAYSTGGYYPDGVAVADFNGDGKLDMVVINAFGNETYNASTSCGYSSKSTIFNGSFTVMTGQGNGTFTARSPITLPCGPNNTTSDDMLASAVAVGDFNHDGLPDVAIIAYGSSSENSALYIYLNSGGALPSSPSFKLSAGSSIQAYSIAVGDLNQDGYPDIVVANLGLDYTAYFYYSTTYPISIFTNKGDGTGNFNAFTSVSLGNDQTAQTVTLGDFNGDGKLDILTGNASYTGATYWQCETTQTIVTTSSTAPSVPAAPAACALSSASQPSEVIAYIPFLGGYYYYDGNSLTDFGGTSSLLVNTTGTTGATPSFSLKNVGAVFYQQLLCGESESRSGGKYTWTYDYCTYFTSDSGVVAADFNVDGKMDWISSDENFGETADTYATSYQSPNPLITAGQ